MRSRSLSRRIGRLIPVILQFLLLYGLFAFAQELPSGSAEDHLKMGLVLQSKGRIPAALEEFTTAVRINPRLAPAYTARGNGLLASGEFTAAIADYDKSIEIQPRSAEAFCNRGIARRAQGDLAGAIQDYTRAVKLQRKMPQAYNNRGCARMRLGDYDGALKDLNEAIRLHGAIRFGPRRIDLRNPSYAEVLVNRGMLRSILNDVAGALKDFEKALEAVPDFAPAHVQRGLALFQKGDVRAAAASLDKAIALHPAIAVINNTSNVEPKMIIGNTGANSYPGTESNPLLAQAYAVRGLTRLALGREKEAQADFGRSLEIDPSLRSFIETESRSIHRK